MLLVTGFTLAAQAALLASQLVFAAIYGASLQTDAFFAAIALPLYLTTVLVSSLAVVFLPSFIEHRDRGAAEDASRIASGAINLTIVALGAIAVAGVVFADPLIGITAPGLPPEGRELARSLAVILWPSVIGSGLVVLFTALWQAGSRFGWSTAVPFIGAVANLLLMVALVAPFGIFAAAFGWTLSLLLQAALLAPIARTHWRPTLGLVHPGVRALLIALAPLVVSSIFIKASTLLERYLGSLLSEGELSHVTYASRIVTVVGLLLAGGVGAVIFPRMAEDVAARDRSRLRARTSEGLRSLWVVGAPVVALLMALADPAVRVALEHGAFRRADSDAVALLLRAYGPALAVIALSTVTGRALYALGAVRVLSVVGAAEGIAYVLYTTYLTRELGAVGIALGLSVYFVGSLAWQLAYLRRALDASGAGFLRSFLAIGLIAALAAVIAWRASGLTNDAPLSLAAGAAAGGLVYVAALTYMRRATRSW